MRPHIVGARLALTLALALAALGWMPAAAQEGEMQVRITQVDTSRFPRITVHISVTDAAGNPVAIDANQIVLMEDGVPVEPEEILGMGEGDPITTLLVLDVSGSMAQRGKMEAAQEAARSYINQMRAGDKAGVLAFNTQVTEVQAITEDKQALLAAIDSLTAIEDTALYDALDRAVDTLEGLPGRKAVIVLMEDGVPVEPEEILGMGEGDLITTLLVLDVSGSMAQRGKLEAAQDAARSYINQMRAGDKAGVLAFNTQVTEVQAITEDTQALLAAIDSLTAIEDTALYDALDRAVDALEGLPGRKAVIVLSDGLDNSSTVTAADVMARVSDAELSVSTIGFGDPGAGAGSMAGIDEALLKDLAQQAGGMYGYAEDAAALSALFQSYGTALQSEYAITYITPSAMRDGVNRSLSVGLSESAAVAGEQRYNPGGVVPEVAEPASWGAFGLALAALAVLLVAPALIRMIGQIPMRVREARASQASAARRDGGKAAPSRAKGRVRLKKAAKPRVRIR
ncbi:MAG: vWA domain-containing protein [Anaerolineales bacterium]